jgi:hypothetical protein
VASASALTASRAPASFSRAARSAKPGCAARASGGYAARMLVWLALAFLVTGAAARRVLLGYPRPQVPTRVLAAREMALLAAAAEATFPAGGAVAPSGREAGVAAYADRYAAAVPAATRRLMRMLFFLMEHATLVFPAPPPRGRRRFSALSMEQRVAVLEAWRTSALFPRRLAFQSLRAILTMGYFAHPPVLRSLGLAPRAIVSPVREADLLYPPIGAGPGSIRYRRADLSAPGPEPPLDPDAPLDPRYAESAS